MLLVAFGEVWRGIAMGFESCLLLGLIRGTGTRDCLQSPAPQANVMSIPWLG
jgi:hypothetical protein